MNRIGTYIGAHSTRGWIRPIRAASLVVAVSVSVTWSQPQIAAVVNAASFQSGLPAGGSLGTIFCSGLTNATPGTFVAPSSPPLPYVLDGLNVTINNAVAPLLAVVVDSSGNAQINFQVPLERNVLAPLNTQGQYTVSLGACGTSVTYSALEDPGGFFADANGYAITQHASDYSLVTSQNPAHPGEAIVAYADGFFPVWPPPSIGFPTPLQPLFQILPASQITESYFAGAGTSLYLQAYPPLTCGIGGTCDNSYASTPALQVTFEGLAPGMVGVEQINFVVPANQQPGNWALFFNQGSCPNGPGTCSRGIIGTSSPYVTLPVQ
jgi:uncharacterized protein (TIGR03437 family)